MGLETGTYINSLNASNPVGASDPKSQGDDHLRLIKSTIKNTFPNITGAMTLTHTQLNNAWHTGNLTVTAAGQALIDDASASAQRTTLGLGSLATLNTVNNANWSGTDLAISNGGTGESSAQAAMDSMLAALSLDVSMTQPRVVCIDAAGAGASRFGEGHFRSTFNIVGTGLTLTAGNGLTGGGNLTANRTFTLGTPTTLTAATTNAVSSTSHSHEIDSSSIVAEGITDIGEGSQGAYAMLKYEIDTDRAHGFTTSGDNLIWGNAAGGGSEGLAGSTWRLHGAITAGSTAGRTSLWSKIT